MTRAALVVPALVALAASCISGSANGRTCEASADCGEGFECVFVPERSREACLPTIRRAATACDDVADCDAAGFPVEVDCVDRLCTCAAEPIACAEGEIAHHLLCACIASDGRAGSACFEDHHCASNICMEGICADGPGREGERCLENDDCASPYVCAVDRCADRRAEGESCDEDADCDFFAGSCVNGFCRSSSGNPGDFCTDDAQCESFVCDSVANQCE